MKYRDLLNVLEKCDGYAKKLSNFGNVNYFDENSPKIGILSPGITTSNPGIESRINITGIPGLTRLVQRK
jgi:hypothetical protein